MRRKRHSLAKRRHSELRRFAGAPLRRFLVKCRSRYHFSIWHMIKRRARLTSETGCGVRKRPGMGRETCLERSDVRSWRCCHHLRLLAVTHCRRREVEGLPRRSTSASGRGANVGFWRVLAVPGPVQSQQPRTVPTAAIFRSARLRSSRGSSTAAGFVEGSLTDWSRVYSVEDAPPTGILMHPFSASQKCPLLRQSAGQRSRWPADRPEPHSMPGSLRNWLRRAGIPRPRSSHGP
jgi:hypothetical protein